MGRILVVDDTAICREPLAAALRLKGHEVITATNGEEALTSIGGSAPFDLMLLDLAMPVMDGLTCLKTLRERDDSKSLPVILLTASGDRQNITTAVQYGVRDYLLKSSFSLTDLFERVTQYIKPAATTAASASTATQPIPPAALQPPHRPAIEPLDVEPTTKAAVLQSIEQTGQLFPAEGALTSARAAAASPGSSQTELLTVVRADPGLCMAVMSAAGKVDATKAKPLTVEDAIRRLGKDSLGQLLDSIPSSPKPQPAPWGYDPAHYVAHALLTANLMNRCCPVTETSPKGMAHVAGLLHKSTVMLMRQALDKSYAGAVYKSVSDNLPITQAEEQLLGITTRELLPIAFEKAGLHPSLSTAINGCTLLMSGKASAQNSSTSITPLARALHVCSMLATGILSGPDAAATVQAITAGDIAGSMLSALPTAEDLDRMKEEVITRVATIFAESPQTNNEKELPRYAKRIWLARHPSLRDPDPVALALANFAPVVVHARLPKVTEARGFHVVIALSQTGEEPGFLPHEVDAFRNSRVPGVSSVWQLTHGKATPGPYSAQAPFALRQLSDMLAA